MNSRPISFNHCEPQVELSGCRLSYRTFLYWQFIAVISLAIAILTFISPQIGQLGRGLRTGLPFLIIACVAIVRINPSAFRGAFFRFQPSFILGFLYLVQAGLRFMYENNAKDLWFIYFWGPLMLLGLLLWVAALAELGQDAVWRLRILVLFGWCLSLSLGIPALINNPGIARETMGNIYFVERAAEWAPRGVGEYQVYSALAVCISALFAIANSLGGLLRWSAFMLVFLSAVSVLLSTFAMAAVILVFNISIALLVWARGGRSVSRMWRVIFVFSTFLILCFLYTQASLFPQTGRVINKVERLCIDISATGLAKGDETGRGDWFVQELKTFLDEPLLGYIPDVTGERGNGHSSLSNSLVIFGIFGSLLWFVAICKVFIVIFRSTYEIEKKQIIIIGGLSLFASGILNPLWHSPAALGTLFVLTISARK